MIFDDFFALEYFWVVLLALFVVLAALIWYWVLLGPCSKPILEVPAWCLMLLR
jgi:hypothetical protein